MDWHSLLTTIFGSGAASVIVIAAFAKWGKDRATNYFDKRVVASIEAHHSRELEKLKNHFTTDLEHQKGNIAGAVELRKFEMPVYNALWLALAKVKLSGDALWREVNDKSLVDFRDKLAEAELLVFAVGALLPAQQHHELVGLIKAFQGFQVGKAELLRNYNTDSAMAADIIEGNRLLWTKYNELFVNLQAKTREHIFSPLAQPELTEG
jgi:hypothetical protein